MIGPRAGTPQRIAVVGAGYVGLTTSACLASLGHTVVCADIDATKIEQLRAGDVRILEPGLSELVADGLAGGRLEFVLGAPAAMTGDPSAPDIVFVCVPTPMNPDGAADLTALWSAVAELRHILPHGGILVIKSTVPVGTASRLRPQLDRDDIAVVSNPEFLREGSAVNDTLHPDRIVIGSDDRHAADRIAGLYGPLAAPVVHTDPASAELAKYAANCFLAMKLSYVNAMSELCDLFGASIDAVTRTMSHDPRIGSTYLRPGPGWGGPCLPKDTHGLIRAAADLGADLPLLTATIAVNARQHRRVVDKIRDAAGGRLAGTRIGLLGLSFKAGTADIRDSPALAIADLLADAGADLVAYDPAVCHTPNGIELVDDPYHAAKDASALVLLTEWPQFRTLDWRQIATMLDRPVVVDARNHLSPDILRSAGLAHIGIA